MTTPATPAPQRRQARDNRARILETARHELGVDPDVTLDEIARKAGVVRRTLYGHFPGRPALLEALAAEAEQALADALAAADHPADGSDVALARHAIHLWRVGDRYRMLFSLARRDLGQERFDEIVGPSVRHTERVLERGLADGTFRGPLPPAVLAHAIEGMSMALLESVNTGVWERADERSVAVATLMAAGVGADRAAEAVSAVRE